MELVQAMLSTSLGRKCPVICLLLLSACIFLCFSSISSFKEQSNRFQELDELCDVLNNIGITNYSILQQKIILRINLSGDESISSEFLMSLFKSPPTNLSKQLNYKNNCLS